MITEWKNDKYFSLSHNQIHPNDNKMSHYNSSIIYKEKDHYNPSGIYQRKYPFLYQQNDQHIQSSISSS
jgi:hypothetical protein